ncbi:hypothetical protein F5X96DRAFT_372384 [Biscogniauxia mediterranea]|nr:hypothetical protein F5X96DRAFT_372384 [Biscogniauxia mediterranea]
MHLRQPDPLDWWAWYELYASVDKAGRYCREAYEVTCRLCSLVDCQGWIVDRGSRIVDHGLGICVYVVKNTKRIRHDEILVLGLALVLVLVLFQIPCCRRGGQRLSGGEMGRGREAPALISYPSFSNMTGPIAFTLLTFSAVSKEADVVLG